MPLVNAVTPPAGLRSDKERGKIMDMFRRWANFGKTDEIARPHVTTIDRQRFVERRLRFRGHHAVCGKYQRFAEGSLAFRCFPIETQRVTARAQVYFRPDGSITNW